VGKCDDYSKDEKVLGRFQSEHDDASAHCPACIIKKDQLNIASQRLEQIYLPPHLDCNPQQVY